MDVPSFALKEWASVCDLLAEGRMCLLLRKGGIREFGGPGVFELEHRRFWLFPTREHERLDRLKPELRPAAEVAEGDSAVTLRAVAEAARLWRVPSREAFDRLDDLHPWLPQAVDMRFDYKPENPLYLVALRVRSAARPLAIPNRPAYRGCRSWVSLDAGDVPAGVSDAPAMSDADFAAVLRRVEAAFAGP